MRLAVEPLIPHCRRRGQEEAAGEDGDDEREAEDGEGVFAEGAAVGGADGLGGGGGGVGLAGEDCHWW